MGFRHEDPNDWLEPAGVATPDNEDWEGMTGAEIARHEFGPSGRIVARNRRESDPCEAGTPGCCIDHMAEADAGVDRDSCDTW